MAIKGRSFLSTHEFSSSELERLLARARALKRGRRKRRARLPLAGKTVALVFLNPSLRTRVTFELAVERLGGKAVTLHPGRDAWTLEHRPGAVMNGDRTEHVRDAVQVLSRVADAVGVRCFAGLKDADEDLRDAVLESFRQHARVPILNLESALYHPFQSMADLMTILERRGKTKGARVALTWAPHPKPLPTAVANSFLLAAAQMGCHVTLAHPEEFPLPPDVVARSEQVAAKAGGSIRRTHRQEDALTGAEVVYAKSWGGLGFYGRWEEEQVVRARGANWIVDERKMSRTADAVFMHCLPVRRNVEVADAVLDGPRSAVYDEAENRLWVQMAVLEAIL